MRHIPDPAGDQNRDLEESQPAWKPGDIILRRGVVNQRLWHAQTAIVVQDTPAELALAILPGAECIVPEGYLQGKQSGKRLWDFKDKPWKLERTSWHTNRLLLLLEPQKYYETVYFWNAATDKFSCYYINFELPFRRSHTGVDTMDLELDLIIEPDMSWKWKDEQDYQTALEHGVIPPGALPGIEAAKREILEKVAKRAYPFNGSWRDWKPEPGWAPPQLPNDWDGI
jgi:hypothetical protein